jgi:hypothetical protein
MTGRSLRRGVTAALVMAVVGLVIVRVEGQGRNGGAGQRAQAAPVPTPRTSDGHPDLSGMWGGGGGGGGEGGEETRPDASGNLSFLQKSRGCAPGATCAPGVNFERDNAIRRRMDPNKPLYKPELWEKVQSNDENQNTEDPTYRCMPNGVPRMGPPSKIVQTPTELIFLYQGGNTFRVIPIDGRPHDPIKAKDQTWMGDSVGRWDGDSLVVDVVGLTDDTWLTIAGYFHTNNMHVTERFRREGNSLTWQATVDDPEVLLKPWTMNARTMRLNLDPRASLIEDLPCDERDQAHLVTKEHH